MKIDRLCCGPCAVFEHLEHCERGWSMLGADFERLYQADIESVVGASHRAIVPAEWSQYCPSQGSEDVLMIDEVPHEWLLPRTMCVVHHGGAGTTAAGVRAGVPSLIVPFGGDQPYWGGRIHALGIGPRPILSTKVSSQNFSADLAEVIEDASMTLRVQQIGRAHREEDGVAAAAAIIEAGANGQ